MKNEIDAKIAELDLPELIRQANCGDMVPRDYQSLVYKISGDEIRKYVGPIVVTASVGAGKTMMMGMIAKRFQDIGYTGLLLARTAELVEQNAEALWLCGAKNSMYSAGTGKKSRAYKISVASEKSFFNVMNTVFDDFVPDYLLLDECLTGDSLIETDCGMIRIDDPALNFSKIKCISEGSGRIFWHQPKRVFTNGIKGVSLIKLTSGDEIKCTDTHKLLSKGSWLRSHLLNAGDELTLSGSQDSFMKKLIRATAAVAKELFQ